MAEDYTASRSMVVTWQDLHRHSRDLARRLAPLGPYKGVLAVARGGLVPAAVIARELDLRLVDTVCIASYRDRVQGNAAIMKEAAAAVGDGAGWLVIDDLADTGITAQTVRAMLPGARFATVYAKPKGRSAVDTFAVEVEQSVWLVFPWDGD